MKTSEIFFAALVIAGFAGFGYYMLSKQEACEKLGGEYIIAGNRGICLQHGTVIKLR